jgi:hypothetical protein
MGGRGGSGRSSAGLIKVPVVDAAAMADMDIRDAYEDALAANPNRTNSFGDWVSMERLRTALAVRGWDRERQDQEILRFVRERKGVLSPDSNQKILSDADRRAQIRQGNENQGIFKIE